MASSDSQLDIASEDYFNWRLKKIDGIIRDLECSLINSTDTDRQLLMCIRMECLKNQTLNSQLEEVQKENKQMLNTLQQSCDDTNLMRCDSKVDVKSNCSTMSMVHLQYKYEELLAHHNGLLKILEMRMSEIRNYQQDNKCLKEQIEIFQLKFDQVKEIMKVKREKFLSLKQKKNKHIAKLKAERDTLRDVHNQLILIIQKQAMERDSQLDQQIKNAPQSDKALLLKEIRKNNLLSYENIKLHQEVDYLRSLLNVSSKSINSTHSVQEIP